MPSEPESERRQFYRVDDHVGIEYRLLEAEPTGPLETLFEGGETLPLEDEFRRHDSEIRHHIALLGESNRTTAQLAKALNDKLDTVARIMAFQQKPLQEDQWLPVTLSEGGVAFPAAAPAPNAGALVAVRLTLLPELSQVVALGRVVDLETGASGQSLVRLQFTQLEDHERQQIARHVLRIQARERQQRRQRDDLQNGQ